MYIYICNIHCEYIYIYTYIYMYKNNYIHTYIYIYVHSVNILRCVDGRVTDVPQLGVPWSRGSDNWMCQNQHSTWKAGAAKSLNLGDSRDTPNLRPQPALLFGTWSNINHWCWRFVRPFETVPSKLRWVCSACVGPSDFFPWVRASGGLANHFLSSKVPFRGLNPSRYSFFNSSPIRTVDSGIVCNSWQT